MSRTTDDARSRLQQTVVFDRLNKKATDRDLQQLISQCPCTVNTEIDQLMRVVERPKTVRLYYTHSLTRALST